MLKGYIFVDFFFLTSGFFLYKSCKIKQKTTFQYTKNRIKKLYFDYIIAFTLLAIFGTIFCYVKFRSVFHIFSEIFMLQNIGLPFATGGINYPTWYISVLVTASPIIYFCLKNFGKKFYNSISTIFVVAIFTILFIFCGKLEYWTNIGWIFYPPWLRGFADILLGTLIAQIAEKYSIQNKVLAIIVELVLFVGVVLLTISKTTLLDFVSPILFAILLFVSSSDLSPSNTIGSTKVFMFLSNFEYILYLNQALVIFIVKDIAINSALSLWLKIIISLTVFISLYILICLIHLLLKKLKNLIVDKIKTKKNEQ